MAKENKKEISFVEGPIFQSLIRFALPLLAGNIFQQLYNMVDRRLTVRSTFSWSAGSAMRRVFPLSEPEATSCRW